MYTHKCTDTCTHTREGALRESGWGRAVGRGAVAFWMPAYPEVGVPGGWGPQRAHSDSPCHGGEAAPCLLTSPVAQEKSQGREKEGRQVGINWSL